MPERPDAIFAASDVFAVAAIKAAKRLGIAIPRDLGVIGFDNTNISVMSEPALTTVKQPQYQLGLLGLRDAHRADAQRLLRPASDHARRGDHHPRVPVNTQSSKQNAHNYADVLWPSKNMFFDGITALCLSSFGLTGGKEHGERPCGAIRCTGSTGAAGTDAFKGFGP